MRNDHFKRRNEAEKSRQESVNVSNVKNNSFRKSKFIFKAVDRDAREYWLKWRETDRKGKDLARECDSLTKQLDAKDKKRIHLEQQMHKIQVEQERRKAVS